MALLTFQDIHKSYGDTVAVRGVSFQVQQGEVFGLLGPNGAGKTTLIRILLDIIRPDAGSVTIFGRLFHRAHLNRITYLPEERGLYRKQKVLDVLTYFGGLQGLTRTEARNRSLQWLERVGLPEVANWRVERLSRGMSQKVQIVSTLLPNPELCVLDEPFSGLDPINIRLVEDLIGERRKNGQTTILSTHQMNLVETLCDRVGMIHQGRLMVYGEVEEVRQRYSLPEVRVQLGSPLPSLEGIADSVQEDETTWRLRLADGTRPEKILAALVGAGTRVERFEKVLAPMEDIFVRVVQEGAA